MSRRFKFKAWNKETKLLMRLNQIECEKGYLVKKDHVLLQFTGHFDKSGTEIYEGDILLFGTDKWMVNWEESRNGWALVAEGSKISLPLATKELTKSIKLCSYYESPESFLK
ncbi:MAG TPA: YopX family protein [Fulvivirga sp.]|nr:YopX family protein [Fulvivirga sp.]